MAEQTLPLAPAREPDGATSVVASRVRRRHIAGFRRALLGVAALVTVLLLAFALPELQRQSPTAQDLTGRLAPPIGLGGSWEHPLGTDGLGRDLLARIAVGARSSLVTSVLAAIGAAAIGIVAGVLSGLLGGLVDRLITLLVETLMAIPFVTIGIVVTATVGQSVSNLILLLIFSGWITHARIVRLQTQSLARAEFVYAAHALGASRLHIAIRHLVPNLAPVILVVLFQQAGAMIIWSASLTYLGIGLPVEQITLGGIVRDGQELVYTAWWVSVFGGLAIALAVAGFNLSADWLQRWLDPTRRHG